MSEELCKDNMQGSGTEWVNCLWDGTKCDSDTQTCYYIKNPNPSGPCSQDRTDGPTYEQACDVINKNYEGTDRYDKCQEAYQKSTDTEGDVIHTFCTGENVIFPL